MLQKRYNGFVKLIVPMKENKNGYPYGWLELNGQLYKVEISESNKDGVVSWVTITKMKKR